MTAKWYVEHYNPYDAAGGVNDLSVPFDSEPEARTYAETLHDAAIRLYKVEDNLFELIDGYHAEGNWYHPVGWEDETTEAQRAEHAVRMALQQEENARRWDEKLREWARAAPRREGTYVNSAYFMTYQDYEKINAYRAEYEAEQAAKP